MQRWVVLFVITIGGGCRPDLGPSDSLLTSARILAVRATPPEAQPGAVASYEAFVARPAGEDHEVAALWQWCTAPKSVAENNIVSQACLDPSSLVRAGTGAAVESATPAAACALFGPDTPPGGFRPRDADATGGYYAPLRVDLVGSDITFYRARVLCNLAGAPTELAARFSREYVPNSNPHLLPLTASLGGAVAMLDSLPRGAEVQLHGGWAADDAETYLYFDRASQTLTHRRESMRIAWYASAGAFDTQSTGRGEDDSANETENSWTAPQLAGSYQFWIVLRDSRGGADYAEYSVRVVP
jgi:hypothetical protein